VGLFAVRGALIATGIGAFIVGAGLLVNQLLLLIERTGGFGVALGLLKDVALGVWDKIQAGGEVLYYGLALTFGNIQDAWITTIGALQLSWGRFVDSVAGSQIGGMMGIEGGNESSAQVLLSAQINANSTSNYELEASLRAAQARISGTTAGMAELRAAMADASDEILTGANSTEDLTAQLNAATRSVGGTSSAARKSAESIRDQISALEDAADPLRVFNRGMAELDALKLEGLSDGAYAAAVKELRDQLEQATPEVGKFTEMFKNGMGDAIDYMVNGFKDGFSGLLDIIKITIMQAIQFAIANPIKLALGIGGGVDGAAGGGGGMLQGVLGKALGGFGDTGSILGMGGLGGGTGLMGGAGNAISGGLGNIFNVGANAAAAGGGFMATLGAALPIIGIAAAVFSFFKTKTKVIDSGIKAVISMEDAVFQSFKEVEKSRFFGLSKKRSTSFETLTGDNDAPLQAAVFGIRESVIGATESLGVSSDIFDNFTHDFSLSLKGLDEAARASAITEEFARMGDNLANLVPHIESMNQLFAVAANRVSLTDRLLQAQGETEELQARIRGREMEATNELNKALLAQVFAAEDAAAAVNKLNTSINENSFATGVDFRRGLSRASNGVEVTPQQSQAEMLAELKALNARIDVLQSTSEITANSSSQTAENTDYSNALTLDAAT
jgi:hypothetical protein